VGTTRSIVQGALESNLPAHATANIQPQHPLASPEPSNLRDSSHHQHKSQAFQPPPPTATSPSRLSPSSPNSNPSLLLRPPRLPLQSRMQPPPRPPLAPPRPLLAPPRPPLAAPQSRRPPPPDSPAPASWEAHSGHNCWQGYGAESDLEKPPGSAAPNAMMRLVSCKELCLTTRGCEGVVFAADMIHGCYRRAGISADLCQPSAIYDLHILLPPSPPPATPPPPAPEPTPPQRPVPRPTPPPPMAVAIDQINERFQSGHPSNTLAEAGVLVHQFDGLEDWDNGRGYRPCHSGWCNGRYDHVSVSLINRQLPLVFNDNGGIVLSTATRFNCAPPGPEQPAPPDPASASRSACHAPGHGPWPTPWPKPARAARLAFGNAPPVTLANMIARNLPLRRL